MKVGDLIRPKLPKDLLEEDSSIEAYLMEIIEVCKTGFAVVILNGRHIGNEHFFPLGDGREWEILNETT